MHPEPPTLFTRTLAGLALGALLACGGGGSSPPPPPASRITYTAPASGAFTFVRNATASTDTHLVLDLLGPAGTSTRGVAFHLVTDTSRLTWAKVAATDAQFAETLFDGSLGFSSIVQTKVAAGELQVAGLLKGSYGYPAYLGPDFPLVTLALDLVPGAPTGDVAVTAPAGRAVLLPAIAGADPQTITLTLGTVTLR